MGPWPVVALGVGLLLVGCATAQNDRSTSSNVTFHTGVPSSAEGAISVEADGWTYSIPLDVLWVDAQGTLHDGDRPACLPPEGATGAVRFASVDVTVEGTSWRQVVWVACSS
jgi:hypothetical protein